MTFEAKYYGRCGVCDECFMEIAPSGVCGCDA